MDIFIQYSTLNEKSRQDNDQKHTQKHLNDYSKEIFSKGKLPLSAFLSIDK